MAQSCGRCSEVGGIQAPEEAELGGVRRPGPRGPLCPQREAASYSSVLFLLTLKKTPFVNRNPFTDFPDYKSGTAP